MRLDPRLCIAPFLLCIEVRSDAVFNWREQWVPSFEADHAGKDMIRLSQMTKAYTPLVEALQHVQRSHNFSDINDNSASVPFLPKVIDLMVNMSDGAEIFTRVVIPWPHDVKRAACLVRSPYGSFGSQNFALIFMVANGHVAIMQESRGTWRSGGKFDMWQSSSNDFRDTSAWIGAQDWSNGEIYSMGMSADGVEAGEEVRALPKNLYGQWYLWTTGNGHRFVYPGGAYREDLMLGYLGNMIKFCSHNVSSDVVLPLTQQHEAFDSWWYNVTDCSPEMQKAGQRGCYYPTVKWPVLVQTAWWDVFHETALEGWDQLRAFGNSTSRDDHVLIVSPLGHQLAAKLNVGLLENRRLRAAEINALIVGAEQSVEFWKWTTCSAEGGLCECQGRVRFGKHTSWSNAQPVRGHIPCDVEHFGDPADRIVKECQCQQATGPLRRRIGRVNLYVMGSFGVEIADGPGNYWTSLDDLPTFDAMPLYLSNSGTEGFLSKSAVLEASSLSYRYDPHNPPPMLGGNNLPFVGKIEFSGSAEQSRREKRKDVLVFTSDPLKDSLAIVGPIAATLFVSSNAADTDFFVTVSDVHPGSNQSWLVRYGIRRMRWRDGDVETSEPMTPGKVYEVSVKLGRTAYIFAKGHRVRVTISSAADPYFNPTSNTGFNDMEKPFRAPIIADNVVHFATERPSRVILPVVSMDAIPENKAFSWFGQSRLESAAHEAIRSQIMI
eukprot:TRINITY_DN13949_c0_g1_i2.p1 TRINITY_DN13949_c0_g1~~TRINITY_DN13949_c0_g1_i2.p1  ORF type:complete len:719 (-),score=53.81 TRINITY_DN13949_c0_g1_i2:303-2459(-)